MQRRTIKVEGFSHAQVQEALDEAGRSGGAIVQLAAGRYVVDQPLELDRGTTLAGAGPRRTELVLAPGANCHVVINRRRGADHISLRGVTIDGAGEHQHPPEGATLRWGCGAAFYGVRALRIIDVATVGVAQTALHLDGCSDVEIDRFRATDSGWSAISSVATNHLRVLRAEVTRAGTTATRSGIHLDGGTSLVVDASVEDCSGNAILVESGAGPVSEVVVRASTRGSTRGLVLVGTPQHPLHHVQVTGTYADHERDGLTISNASHVTVIDAIITGNGERGISLQGRRGAHSCVFLGTTLGGQPTDIDEQPIGSDNHVLVSVPVERAVEAPTAPEPGAPAPAPAPPAARPSPAKKPVPRSRTRRVLRRITPKPIRRWGRRVQKSRRA